MEVIERIGNQVANGNFSGGNVSFSSNYSFTSNLQPAGVYWVGPNSNMVHPLFFSVTDHTTGSGNFMVVNGSGTPNINVWCQEISVDPNTEYDFSTWITSVHPSSPAILQFSINGSELGPTFSAPGTPGVWQEFTASWVSGNSTSATICIVNQNTNTSGNDFGIDDISFSPICRQTDDVLVTVHPMPVPDAGADESICTGVTTTLTASGGTTYSWSTGNQQASFNIQPIVTTTYTVTVSTDPACTASDAVTITVNPLPIADAGADQAICPRGSAMLIAQGGTVYLWSTGNSINPETVSPASNTIYSVTVTDANNCSAIDQTEVTIHPDPSVNIAPLHK